MGTPYRIEYKGIVSISGHSDGIGAIEKYKAVIRHTLKKDIEGLL